MQPEIITIVIPPAMWRDVGGDGSLLKCVISINGTLMHLEAMQVRYDGDPREQRSANPLHQADFEALCQFGSEGQFDTSDIDGKPYVLVATPFT